MRLVRAGGHQSRLALAGGLWAMTCMESNNFGASGFIEGEVSREQDQGSSTRPPNVNSQWPSRVVTTDGHTRTTMAGVLNAKTCPSGPGSLA